MTMVYCTKHKAKKNKKRENKIIIEQPSKLFVGGENCFLVPVVPVLLGGTVKNTDAPSTFF